MATIKEVAKLAGVSVGTVSKVLNNQNNIKDSNKKRVLEAIKELNYEPNIHARTLSSGKTHLISVVVPTVGFEFQKIFLTSVDDVLRESNYDSAIFPLLSRDRLVRFSDENNFLYHTDAVIISSLAPERLFKEGKIPTKKPYIIVDSHGDYKNSVTINNFLGGYLAGKNLKIHKNKKIYLIGGYETDDIFSSGVFGERTKGFIKALEDRGINYSDIEIENIVLDWNQAFDFGKKVSQFQKNFSVFSVSDLVAWGFTEGCRVNNLISGRDYHIIGYDNCSFAEKIGLTTINQPISDLGTISAQKILEKINGSDRDENVVLNPDYVERNSN